MSDKITDLLMRLRSPVTRLIDNKKTSCDIDLHNLAISNTSARTKHIFTSNLGTIIDQCTTQTQLLR
jgi:hypothetical protein